MSNHQHICHHWMNHHWIHLSCFDEKRISNWNNDFQQCHALRDHFYFDEFNVKISFQFEIYLQIQYTNMRFKNNDHVIDVYHCNHVEFFHFLWQINQFIFFWCEKNVMLFCSLHANIMHFFQHNAIHFCEFIICQQIYIIDEIYRRNAHIWSVDQFQ